MKISVIGAGHVGLVTGACFADLGNQVVMTDDDHHKIALLKRGKMPFYEPGLQELVRRGIAQRRLSFTTLLTDAVDHGVILFICVGTPARPGGEADLSAVEQVARGVAKAMRSYRLIVEKSTVPVETGEWIKRTVRLAVRRKVAFDVASNPEFLREGQAIHDFLHPDRIVLGVESKPARQLLTELYSPLHAPLVVTDIKSSELIKHASNSFLALKISFINMVAQLCDRVGADAVKVADGMGLDKRIGRSFLDAGVGYGGYCLAGGELVLVRHPSGTVELVPIRKVVETSTYTQDGYEVFNVDPMTGVSAFRRILAASRRQYTGPMLTLTTRMNKSVTVTADHPMLVADAGAIAVRIAEDVKPGDLLPCFLGFPEPSSPAGSLDVIAELQRHTLFDARTVKVRLKPEHGSFRSHHATLKEACRRVGIARQRFHDIERRNCMQLAEYLRLEEFLPFGHSACLLFTTLGTPTYLSAVISWDERFCRLLGYYTAEGSISYERGLRGTRARICWTFHEAEQEYVSDVTEMLSTLGLRSTRLHVQDNHSVRITCSSRLLAWLLEERLQCGRGSYTAQVPPRIFERPREQRLAFLRGVFRGDGSISWRRNTPAVTFDFGSVSERLVRGMIFLFHSVGIVPSYKTSRSKKSTRAAHFLRISGFQQIQRLTGFKDATVQQRIDAQLGQYQRFIKPTGYTLVEEADDHPYALVKVKSIHRRRQALPVYSLEVEGTHTFVTTDGLAVHNCFPKDVSAFIRIAEQRGVEFNILKAAAEVNQEQRRWFVTRVARALWNLNNKTIAVLGLAFKPETDDLREAPAVDIVRMLQQEGASVRVFDPKAAPSANGLFRGVSFGSDVYATARGADCLALVTEWNEFKELDFARLKKLMRQPVIVDGRNIYDPEAMRKLGFRYIGMGRGHDAD